MPDHAATPKGVTEVIVSLALLPDDLPDPVSAWIPPGHVSSQSCATRRRGLAVAIAVGMTPFSQPAESPLRSRRSWPSIAWKVVVMSAVAMALAVSLTAWQAARTCTKHRQRDARAARPFVIYPAPLDARGSAGVVVRNYGERVPTEEVRRMICPAMREVAP